jgi:PAS domain S-box-containing protein
MDELTETLQLKTKLAAELRAAQQLFQEYAKRSPNATYIKTETGRYIFYNRVFADLFGISETEWIGKYFYEVLPKEVADRFSAQYLELLSGSTDVQTTEHLATPVERCASSE